MNVTKSAVQSFSQELIAATGIDINRCYQCGKCSAGCPMSLEMDYPPSMVLRLLQTEDPELISRAVKSYSIWLCLSCETCLCRCPMEIETAKVMDFLRHRALKNRQVNPRARKIVAFHKAFLTTLKRHGKLYEIGMTLNYKMRSGEFLKDMVLVPGMFLRGKLNIFPERIKNRKQLKNIMIKSSK
jgi:heterodisulfide reductase subunit C